MDFIVNALCLVRISCDGVDNTGPLLFIYFLNKAAFCKYIFKNKFFLNFCSVVYCQTSCRIRCLKGRFGSALFMSKLHVCAEDDAYY